MTEDRCYFCERDWVEFRKVCVDAEPDEFNEGMLGIYETVPLCEEHLHEYEERLGIFDPYKYL